MSLRVNDPCLVADRETGETYMGVVIKFDDVSVTIENHHTKEQRIHEREEIMPARWSVPGGKKRKQKSRKPDNKSKRRNRRCKSR